MLALQSDQPTRSRSTKWTALGLICMSIAALLGCNPPQTQQSATPPPSDTPLINQPSPAVVTQQTQRPETSTQKPDVYAKYVEQLGKDFRRELSQLQAGQADTLQETKTLIKKGEDLVQQAEKSIDEWRQSDYFAAKDL